MNSKFHWFSQRITAVVMVFLLIVSSIISLSGINSMLFYFLICFIGTWHGLLGMQIICEDYISNIPLRKFTILTIQIITYSILLLVLLVILLQFLRLSFNSFFYY